MLRFNIPESSLDFDPPVYRGISWPQSRIASRVDDLQPRGSMLKEPDCFDKRPVSPDFASQRRGGQAETNGRSLNACGGRI
jgi:hypothetical protein